MLRKFVFTLLVVVMATSVWVGAVAADQETVTVCHKPGTPAQATLEIAAPALNAHLGHGDYEGECHGPESAGCAALNAIVPDLQTETGFYLFQVGDLDFLPGETIHVDMTATTSGEVFGGAIVVVFDGNVQFLAFDAFGLVTGDLFDPGQHTFSADYVVVAGDDADGAAATFQQAGGDGSITLDAVHFSCSPAS